MNVLGCFLAARNIQVPAAGGAGTDEDGVPAFRQHGLEAVDTLATVEFDAEVEDVAAFLVDDGVRKTEFRDLGADHAAGLGILIEHNAGVAERGKVASDS